MAITISIQEPEGQIEPQQSTVPQKPEPPKESNIKVRLNMRRSLDGNVMVFDHKDIDIVLSTEKMKIVCFTKGSFSDHIYASQNRFFEFMSKKGVTDPESVKGGHVYGSIEAKILKPVQDIPVDQIILLTISKWIEEERPQMEFNEKYEEEFEQFLTEPDEEDSTELGEVPQEAEKGSIPKYSPRRYTGNVGASI